MDKKISYGWYTIRYNGPLRSNIHFLIKKIEQLKLIELIKSMVDQHCLYSKRLKLKLTVKDLFDKQRQI